MIELVVAMPIMLIVMGGLVIMLTTLTHESSQTQEETILQTEARSAINTMELELRGAFTGDTTPTIVSAGPNSITFYSPDEYATTVVGSTESSFHLREISYQVTSTGLLQRQFMTSTNTYPTATCISCGGTAQWAWPGGGMSAWTTVVGSSGTIINTDPTKNTCTPNLSSAGPVPAVFCYYTGQNILTYVNDPQAPSGWTDTWVPQPFTAGFLSAANLQPVTTVVITLELSSGGSQPVKFLVSNTMTIRGTS